MFCLRNGDGERANLWYGEFSIFPGTMVTAAVSARQGGVSHGIYRSLNLALHVGFDPSAVVENRRRFLSVLGLDFDRLVTAQQTHSDRVAVVTASDAGLGSRIYTDQCAGPSLDGLCGGLYAGTAFRPGKAGSGGRSCGLAGKLRFNRRPGGRNHDSGLRLQAR